MVDSNSHTLTLSYTPLLSWWTLIHTHSLSPTHHYCRGGLWNTHTPSCTSLLLFSFASDPHLPLYQEAGGGDGGGAARDRADAHRGGHWRDADQGVQSAGGNQQPPAQRHEAAAQPAGLRQRAGQCTAGAWGQGGGGEPLGVGVRGGGGGVPLGESAV